MIKIVKLVTGEEIIGDVDEIANQHNEIKISKPCVIQLVPSRGNPEQIGMALLPYAAYTKDHTILVKASCVVWTQEPVKELYNQYNSIFGNGLVVASNIKL